MSNPDPQKDWPHPYERPNQKWICGRSESGVPCRLGPDQRGRCRTTAECAPVLELKPGEEKGHYRCTRPPEFGGPCSEGPLPSGACSHSLAPCGPIRSWRSRRAIFTWWIAALTVSALLLALSGPLRFRFMNPGPVSSAHSQPRGGANNATKVGSENCGACHRGAADGWKSWIEGGAGATPALMRLDAAGGHSSLLATPMDRSCSACHTGHNFHHAAGVAEKISCLSCHTEHEGDAGLHQRSATECARCHGDREYLLEHARRAGRESSQTNVPRTLLAGFVNEFSADHPEFSILSSGRKDTNALRFNHQLHLTGSVREADGSQLQCADCHQTDAAGAYHRPISFAQHCQRCHALQFDPANPQLHLPHGEVRFVQAFLASLPDQYERFGREAHNITERRALSDFVRANMTRMQEAQLAGENLSQRIFFNRDRTSSAPRVSNLPAAQSAAFYGCAYCHEVSGSSASPHVTPPAVPQRWLARGSFHHLSHRTIACNSCHNVTASRETSDILLPGVRSCASCHNPKAAPGESCIVCHDYHSNRSGL